MQYAVRLLTHRGRPTGYEIYEPRNRKVVFYYGAQDDTSLAQALERANEHASKLNAAHGVSNEKTSEEGSTSVSDATTGATGVESVASGGSNATEDRRHGAPDDGPHAARKDGTDPTESSG